MEFQIDLHLLNRNIKNIKIEIMKTTLIRIATILFIAGFIFSAHAQEIEVSGTVYDDQNKSLLPGVTVMVKGTNNGSVSDVNGKYRIKTERGKTLVFSFIGFLQQEIKVENSQLDVYLKPDLQSLDEVVVVAFGSQKRESVVGSVAVADHSYYRPPVVMPFPREVNTEEYEAFKENRFLSAVQNPLSTFSLDVDAASYGNIRRMINQGQMPGKDAVRVEEMINYFSYSYPQPTDGHPVRIVTETAVCPWNKKHNIVRIGVKAKEIPSETLPASNFVFLIDVSGSMYEADKLPLVKSSMKLLVNNLRPKDRVAIVAYAGAVGEVLPSTSASDKQKIMDALENLQAGGSTAGGAGI